MQDNATTPVTINTPHQLGDDVSSAAGLLLSFDFDGTLAPIANDPDKPTLSNALERPLRTLVSRQSVRVAILSGRALDDLVERVGIDGITYAGNHGLELYRDGEVTVQHAVERCQPSVRSVCTTLRSKLSDIPGCHVENKELTVAVHVRRTPTHRVDDVRQSVYETVTEHEGVRVDEGKQVFDIRPDISLDKGTTMAMLVDETPTEWQTVYLGDDTTDEDAFRAIQPEGIAIRVGTRTASAANYRIPEQRQVASFVDWVATTVSGA